MQLPPFFKSEAFKYLILLAAAPLWVPFLKALWEELNGALRDEGGLLGEAPRPEDLERLKREKPLPDNMVSELRDDAPLGRFGSPRSRGARSGGGRPGFRPGGGH